MNIVFIGLFEFFIVLPVAIALVGLVIAGIMHAVLWIGGLRR